MVWELRILAKELQLKQINDLSILNNQQKQTMRKLFKDASFQTQFEQDGYLIIDLPNPAILDEIDNAYQSLRPNDKFEPQNGRYHCTFIDSNLDYKRKANELFLEYFTPFVNDFFLDYELFTGNFYVKPKNSCEFEVHQNWSVVDETKHTTLTLWIPMQDTFEYNGTIEIVPGSNKISNNITCLFSPYYFNNFEQELKQKYFKSINLKKGQVVIFDDNIIHYSKINKSDDPRRAMQLIAVPKEADLMIHFIDPKDSNYFNIFETNKEFYLTHDLSHFMDGTPPLKKIRRVANTNVLLTESEFISALSNGKQYRKELYSADNITTTELTKKYKKKTSWLQRLNPFKGN